MQIRSATFFLSSSEAKQIPKPGLPEFAFIGRSNVGKSSLINLLCNQKGLAKTSAAPGKTRLINHFLINKNCYFVDLPGYGYEKASKSDKEQFEVLITDYLETRKTLTCLFILIDIRLPLQGIDLDFMKWCGKKEIPFAIVFTKSDKLSRSELDKNLKEYTNRLLRWWEDLPGIFITSSTRQTGREDLLTYIGELCANKKP